METDEKITPLLGYRKEVSPRADSLGGCSNRS